MGGLGWEGVFRGHSGRFRDGVRNGGIEIVLCPLFEAVSGMPPS